MVFISICQKYFVLLCVCVEWFSCKYNKKLEKQFMVIDKNAKKRKELKDLQKNKK